MLSLSRDVVCLPVFVLLLEVKEQLISQSAVKSEVLTGCRTPAATNLLYQISYHITPEKWHSPTYEKYTLSIDKYLLLSESWHEVQSTLRTLRVPSCGGSVNTDATLVLSQKKQSC